MSPPKVSDDSEDLSPPQVNDEPRVRRAPTAAVDTTEPEAREPKRTLSGTLSQEQDDFDQLLRRLARSHSLEISRLQREVQRLQTQPAGACEKAPQQADCSTRPNTRECSPEERPRQSNRPEPLAFNGDASPKPKGDDDRGGLGGAEAKKLEDAEVRSCGTTSKTEPYLFSPTGSWKGTTLAKGLSRGLTYKFKSQRRQSGNGNGSFVSNCLRNLVEKPSFEVFIAVMITINGCIMAAEAQYLGFDLARWTGHPSAAGTSAETWPHAPEVFENIQFGFGVFFFCEIALKIIALRWEFSQDRWNFIDATVVGVWLYSQLAGSANANSVRLARLARLVRLVRLLRFLQSATFDSLYLMTIALRGSLSILTWSFLLLLALHMILALIVNQALRELYFRESHAEQQREVFMYYGSFSRAFLTMFELTLANWPPAARVLMEDVHESLLLYAVLHKMVLGFAIIGVVNGVFVQETFKVATLDDTVMVRQTLRKEAAHIQKMRRLFVETDQNKDGCLDVNEWRTICEEPWVRVWLASQDLDSRDPDGLFKALDDGSGEITADCLVEGTARLKAQASSMHLARTLSNISQSLVTIQKEMGLDPEPPTIP